MKGVRVIVAVKVLVGDWVIVGVKVNGVGVYIGVDVNVMVTVIVGVLVLFLIVSRLPQRVINPRQ